MSLAYRVAARHLLAHSPKDLLKLVEATSRRATPLLRDESRLEELKELYLSLAKEVRPLASALEGVSFRRPDEAKKLKNLQSWLKTIERRTRPNIFDDAESVRDVQIAVPMFLEDLETVLKSIARSGTRLEDYATIERSFSHGPYKIVNNYGFRPEEYSEPLAVLDEAAEAIKAAGFGSALYGDVILQAIKGAGWAGMYRAASDDIQLNITARHRFDSVYTMVHEHGHRVWFKTMSEAKRDAYEDAYVGKASPISLAKRISFWEALKGSDFEPAQAKASLPKEDQAIFQAYWKDITSIVMRPSVKTFTENPDMVYKTYVQPKQRYYFIDRAGIESVTDYGATAVTEDFAEVFAHVVLRKAVSPDALARFKAAT